MDDDRQFVDFDAADRTRWRVLFHPSGGFGSVCQLKTATARKQGLPVPALPRVLKRFSATSMPDAAARAKVLLRDEVGVMLQE